MEDKLDRLDRYDNSDLSMKRVTGWREGDDAREQSQRKQLLKDWSNSFPAMVGSRALHAFEIGG
jgi:hypothetical protein